jgi:putative peptide zinc metalloprotease protein
MSDSSATFSESWHRVANQRLSLHPGVRVRRQVYRGERYYVLENPMANQFFRIRPPAYEFVARLRSDRTVDEVWRECLEVFPEEAPGQEAVVLLLGQLYQANLLQYDHALDTAELFKRHQKRTSQEMRSRLANIMFFRIPLLDPDRFLVRLLPLVGPLFSVFGLILWLGVVVAGLMHVAGNWQAVENQYQGVLAPGNLPLLYAGLVFLKTIHEFGHAFACRKFGGEVHTMGIMFMIFTPVPYVDVTSSWSIRSRWRRALVGSAGMIVELFVAAIAAVVWARSAPGVVHSLAYNMMFVASVSTLVFNLNPLLRFDGYYILSDLLELPNLGQRSNQHLRHLSESGLFGVKRSQSPARTTAEAWTFTLFGITSGIYRVIVFAGVLLAVADRYLLLGIVMLATCAISWVIVPTGSFLNYLSTSPRLDRVRVRAWAVSLALLALVVVPIGVLPFPNHFRAPGIVQSVDRSAVFTEAPGRVVRLLSTPGSEVRRGQPLLLLTNREIELEWISGRAALVEMEARLRQSLSEEIANLKPLYSRQAALSNRVVRLELERSNLVVRAPIDGIWTSPDVQDFTGRVVPRGSPLGLIVKPGAVEFSATVLQSDADRLFRTSQRSAEVRIPGQGGIVVPVSRVEVVQAERQNLPSAALGWHAGGEVATSQTDPQGRKAAEPFFEVRAELPQSSDVLLRHGRSGKIRFDLPPEPLLQQWWRRLMQLLQRRYQV